MPSHEESRRYVWFDCPLAYIAISVINELTKASADAIELGLRASHCAWPDWVILRACCLPWMWKPFRRLPLWNQTLIFRWQAHGTQVTSETDRRRRVPREVCYLCRSPSFPGVLANFACMKTLQRHECINIKITKMRMKVMIWLRTSAKSDTSHWLRSQKHAIINAPRSMPTLTNEGPGHKATAGMTGDRWRHPPPPRPPWPECC